MRLCNISHHTVTSLTYAAQYLKLLFVCEWLNEGDTKNCDGDPLSFFYRWRAKGKHADSCLKADDFIVQAPIKMMYYIFQSFYSWENAGCGANRNVMLGCYQ